MVCGMKKTLALGLALTLAAGCSDIHVETSQDPSANFGAVKTWSWYEMVSDQPADPTIPELSRRRIKNCIQTELEARGYKWAPADQADILIKWLALTGGPVDMNPIGFRFGESDAPPPPDTGSSVTVSEGSLVIDVIWNKPPRKIIWRGSAEGTVSRGVPDEVRQARIEEAVGKTLHSFPSRPK
jgi:hypothetical protein